ncbi:response regulator [Nostoc sp. FACHB-152]|uniref:response regulator n=1 Tax=unclassified Nostoc TaxID=2593658 RepID=UPI0016832D91|nr:MULTISPECIES: response regulator [unclassified Nostoc]MBD2449635.1 response regulator [Nostoc sp. FACHB-152]MBD2469701.1 response regulator [Nostoc sp. FACHB-145]
MSELPSISYKELYRFWFSKLTREQQLAEIRATFTRFQSAVEAIEGINYRIQLSQLNSTPAESTPRRFDSASRIVIADGCSENLALLKLVLELEGYEIVLADTGSKALSLIEAHQPDLALLNVVLPRISGYELTRCLRNHPRFVYLPILLITACSTSLIQQGLECGANDMIHQPISIRDLLLKIRVFCN